jgi:hypothetical protein
MVILNASSETGINIHGKVDYIIVHNRQEETRTQIRGRYRHDLERLYLWDNKSFQVPEEFLDCDLSAEQRERLCQIIGIYDDKGRLCKWTTIRKRIEAAGYSVAEKRMVNNILIEVLGTIAEQERETIRKRQAEGIEAAKANGKKLGRPALTFTANWDKVYASWKSGEITAKTAMEMTDTKRTSFYKLVGMMEEE